MTLIFHPILILLIVIQSRQSHFLINTLIELWEKSVTLKILGHLRQINPLTELRRHCSVINTTPTNHEHTLDRILIRISRQHLHTMLQTSGEKHILREIFRFEGVTENYVEPVLERS